MNALAFRSRAGPRRGAGRDQPVRRDTSPVLTPRRTPAARHEPQRLSAPHAARSIRVHIVLAAPRRKSRTPAPKASQSAKLRIGNRAIDFTRRGPAAQSAGLRCFLELDLLKR